MYTTMELENVSFMNNAANQIFLIHGCSVRMSKRRLLYTFNIYFSIPQIIKKLIQNQNSTGCFIAGSFTESEDFIKKAVQSSSNAFELWKNDPLRGKILKRYYASGNIQKA